MELTLEGVHRSDSLVEATASTHFMRRVFADPARSPYGWHMPMAKTFGPRRLATNPRCLTFGFCRLGFSLDEERQW